MKNLYIDFDGVIMNTIEVTYEDLKKLNLDIKNPENAEKVRTFYASIDWKELLNKRATIINDGINCIKKIIKSGRFNVAILSHVNSLNEAVEKVSFIRKYLKDITIIPVPREISKTEMVHTEGAILVDDFYGNLIEWEDKKGYGIRFSIKENGTKGFKTINRLDQLLEIDFE